MIVASRPILIMDDYANDVVPYLTKDLKLDLVPTYMITQPNYLGGVFSLYMHNSTAL